MVGNTFLIWTLILKLRMIWIPHGMHMDIIELAPSTFMLMPNSPPLFSSVSLKDAHGKKTKCCGRISLVKGTARLELF